MTTQLSWLDESQKIMLAKTFGMWKPVELLEQLTLALEYETIYLVWDPTEVFFPVQFRDGYETGDPKRKDMMIMISTALKERRLKSFFVIQKTESPAYTAMKEMSIILEIEAYYHFVDSIERVYEAIDNPRMNP